MRFRLGWPDFALFALLALISWDFLSKYRQSAGRHSILESVSAGSQESRSPAVPPPEAIRPADYGAIASSLFFVPQSSSAPEATPRPLVEAPPGPLPVLFGVADLGDGPSALLSPYARRAGPMDLAGRDDRRVQASGNRRWAIGVHSKRSALSDHSGRVAGRQRPKGRIPACARCASPSAGGRRGQKRNRPRPACDCGKRISHRHGVSSGAVCCGCGRRSPRTAPCSEGTCGGSARRRLESSTGGKRGSPRAESP